MDVPRNGEIIIAGGGQLTSQRVTTPYTIYTEGVPNGDVIYQKLLLLWDNIPLRMILSKWIMDMKPTAQISNSTPRR